MMIYLAMLLGVAIAFFAKLVTGFDVFQSLMAAFGFTAVAFLAFISRDLDKIANKERN